MNFSLFVKKLAGENTMQGRDRGNTNKLKILPYGLKYSLCFLLLIKKEKKLGWKEKIASRVRGQNRKKNNNTIRQALLGRNGIQDPLLSGLGK